VEKRIVCLANSWKNHGRCVAGIELDSGEWIRPVNSGGGKLLKTQIKNQFGAQPKVLDIINIPVMKEDPLYYQPENYIIDTDKKWQFTGRFKFKDLSNLSCSGNNICLDCDFFNDNRKSIPSDELNISNCKHSLSLIKPQDLKIEKFDRSQWNQKPQIKANFLFGEKYYNLVITDDKFKAPFFEDNSLDECGFYELNTNEVYLTISLGEIYKRDKSHYKLVAAVIVNGNYSFRKI
jgi:hypothetical protein